MDRRMEYSIHSIRLSSNYPFAFLPPADEPAPVVRFHLVTAPAPGLPRTAREQCTLPGPEGGTIRFWRDGLTYWIESPTVGQFRIAPGEEGILCHARPDFHAGDLRHQTLRLALSLALHQRGINHLHASGVSLQGTGRAVGLMGYAGQGKSTLTAALVHHGHGLVGDDLLAVSGSPSGVLAHPGSEEIRLLADACEWLGIGTGRCAPEEKALVTAAELGGSTVRAAVPLALLALVERCREVEDARLERLGLREAFLALLAHSHCRSLLPAAAQQGVVSELAGFLSRLPVYRLTFPDRWEGLCLAERALLEELCAAAPLPNPEATPCLMN